MVGIIALVILSPWPIPSPVHAQVEPVKYKFQIPIPGLGDEITLCKKQLKPGTSTYELNCDGLARYIGAIYKWIIGAAAILSVLILMASGLQYLTAGGGGKAADAQERIKNALIGLVLLLCTTVILSIINPAFINLQTFNIGLEQGGIKLDAKELAADLEFSRAERGLISAAPGEPSRNFANVTFQPNPKKDVEGAGKPISSTLSSLLHAIDAAGIHVVVSTLNTGHSVTTRSGKRSLHVDGRGADIVGTHTELIKLSRFLADHHVGKIYEMFYCHPQAPLIKKGVVIAANGEYGLRQLWGENELCNDHRSHLHFGVY